MSGVIRESWYLVGFVTLAVAALAVSAAGWILFARERREGRAARSGGREEAAPGSS